MNFLFILNVANIRCFILIAVEIFHNIMHKQPRTKEIRRCFIFLNPVKNLVCLSAQYSYDLTVNSFGKAFAHVRNCLLMKKAHDANRILELNKNIDGFYTKTTQKGGFSELCAKIEKTYYTDLFHFSTRKHNLVSFFRLNHILTVELHRRFYIFFFSQEKTLGDISFKLETKIMNFISGF